MTDKQCSSCGGDCGKVCERENVAGLCNKWIIEALQRDDFVYVKDNAFLRLKSIGGLTLIAELKARWVRNHLIKEPPNFPPEVVEPYNGWVLRKVYFEDGEPLMHSEPENTQAQELADYRLKLLTKMPSEWVGLTDEEIAQAVGSPIDEVYLSDFRKVEAKLKEKNNA